MADEADVPRVKEYVRVLDEKGQDAAVDFSVGFNAADWAFAAYLLGNRMDFYRREALSHLEEATPKLPPTQPDGVIPELVDQADMVAAVGMAMALTKGPDDPLFQMLRRVSRTLSMMTKREFVAVNERRKRLCKE